MTDKDKFQELLAMLPKDLTQSKMHWVENLPDDIWEAHLKDNFKEVYYNLDVSKHRHYEVSTDVVQVYGHFLGIRHITNIYSERSEVQDCGVVMQFFEMEEVQTVSYKRI